VRVCHQSLDEAVVVVGGAAAAALLLLLSCFDEVRWLCFFGVSSSGEVTFFSSSEELSSGEWCADLDRRLEERFFRGEVVVEALPATVVVVVEGDFCIIEVSSRGRAAVEFVVLEALELAVVLMEEVEALEGDDLRVFSSPGDGDFSSSRIWVDDEAKVLFPE